MRAEDLNKLSVEELQRQANRCFELARSPSEAPPIVGGVNDPYVITDEDKFRLLLEAQFYLTAIGRKQDEQTSKRDYQLEIWVIVLIGFEILLSVVGIVVGIRDAREQSFVLTAIERQTSNSASAMSTAGGLLKTLDDEQKASIAHLQKMNNNLQGSLQKTSSMANAVQKQLLILQDEQTSRLAQLAKKPKLQLMISSILLPPSGVLPAKARISTEDRSVYDVVLANSGDAAATKGFLRIVVTGKNTWIETTGGTNHVYEQPDADVHTYIVQFELLRPNVSMPMSVTVGYPKGQQTAVIAIFNVDVDELPAATPLGTLIVIPPQSDGGK